MSNIYKYAWLDGMRPDTFSEKYYGTNELYWLALFSGGIYDIHNELPREEWVILKYLWKKYNQDPRFTAYCAALNKPKTEERLYDWAALTTKEYRDSEGNVIDIFNDMQYTWDRYSTNPSFIAYFNSIPGNANRNPTRQDVFTWATTTIIEYRDQNGNVVNQNTPGAIPISVLAYEAENIKISIFEYEIEQNEAKRNVNIIDDSFGTRFRMDYDSQMNKLQADLEE
jgi:hypothetical protein